MSEIRITGESVDRYVAQGYTSAEALALSGVRLVGETPEEWGRRTLQIMLRKNLGEISKAIGG